MAEPNILLTRIDNRLVHGQVATQWNSTLGSNLILVANDDVASNTMRQNLMKMAAPAGVATRFFSLQKTIDVIGKASPRQKIFIVAETPEDVLTLVKGGVPIKKVNIGNMHMSEGKRQSRPPSQLTTRMSLRLKSCRNWGWSWRSGAFRARLLRTRASSSRNPRDPRCQE